MKTKMRDTSLDAYNSIRRDLQKKEKLVLGALIALKGRATNREIAAYLQWEINRITGRTFSLHEKGIINAGKKVVDPETQRPAIQWVFNSLQLKLL
jgi:transcription initiation factor IIE alpha subunit